MKLLRFLLFPFAVLYDLITSVRNFLFDKGLLRSTSFNIPVIAVGNLNVGGTGKTPQIEYLIRLLKDDYKIAILSRGYKRKTAGFLLLNTGHTAEDVGDEPLQFFKKFTAIQVAVDANRINGIKQLLAQENPPEIVLLDDAFQHRKVTASFYVLLTKYSDLYTNDFLLPTGNLRESGRGAKRANIIMVTKCPENLSVKNKLSIIKKLAPKNNQQVFFSTIVYADSIQGKQGIAIEKLNEYEIILVTGIANPTSLLEFLDTKYVTYNHVNFPDHYNFTEADINKIEAKLNTISSTKKLILTTEKDFVRLENKLQNLYYLPIKTSLLEQKEDFNNTIINHIKS